MKNNWQMKKIGEIKKVWLAQWGCHAQNEDKCLKQSGITRKIIDVFSIRKEFDKHIIEIAKDIYKREMLSFSEKIYLSDYAKGEQRKREFFSKSIPVFTHYNSDLYRNMMEIISSKGFDNLETKELLNKWIKYPQYVIIGHNPYLEIIKVFNLFIYANKNGNEVIEWDRPLADGSYKKEKYESKK